jgi:hypothetical protein
LATGAISIVSFSSGTNPAARSLCERSFGRSCSCSFDLARDQLVELRILEPAEIAIDDEAAPCQTEEAQERPVALDRDTPRQRLGDVVAKLRVIRGQQLRCVGHQRTLGPRPIKVAVVPVVRTEESLSMRPNDANVRRRVGDG